MADKQRYYTKQNLEFVDTQIEIVKQEIEFERVMFGHVYPLEDSPRVAHLKEELRVLYQQRATVYLTMR